MRLVILAASLALAGCVEMTAMGVDSDKVETRLSKPVVAMGAAFARVMTFGLSDSFVSEAAGIASGERERQSTKRTLQAIRATNPIASLFGYIVGAVTWTLVLAHTSNRRRIR